MTMINPLTATSATTSAAPAAAAATGLAQLANPQMFLQLLVAELKNENPLNPTNTSAMLSQTSQLASTEAMQQMETLTASATSAGELGSATSLIGKQIAAVSSGGAKTSGVVTGVTVDPKSGPMLDVNGLQVPLADVTQVT